MKNLLLVIIVFLSLVSCVKKGEPEYKGNNVIQGQKITI